MPQVSPGQGQRARPYALGIAVIAAALPTTVIVASVGLVLLRLIVFI
jgi:hypothetical protein